MRKLWGMLYADDAGILSRSSAGPERMMTVIATACSAFGLTISDAKTEIMCLQTKVGRRRRSPSMQPARYTKTITFVYLGGAITADRELCIEITRRLQRVWACFQRYKKKVYDRPGVRLRSKVQWLKDDVVETLLYGCMMWNPNKSDYNRLRRVHHSMLLRCLGWRERKHDDHTLSYADTLVKTAPESIEGIKRKRGRSVCHRVRCLGGLLGVRATQGSKRTTGWCA